METLTGTILPRNNFGWYFRPSTQCYEFWWLSEADRPWIVLTSNLLDCMPSEIANEILVSVSLKGDKGTLD